MKKLSITLTKLEVKDISKMISNSDLLSKEADYKISHDKIDPNIIIGSIVWAKVDGYPWWPAMVDDDPNLGKFSLCKKDNKHISHYHVVFLDKKVSRSWVRKSCIHQFASTNIEIVQSISKHPKGKKFLRQIKSAKLSAKKALKMSLKQRLETYGFLQRYNPKNTWKHESVGSSNEEEYSELLNDKKRPKRRHILKDEKSHLLQKEQLDNFLSLTLKDDDPSDDKLISDAENLLSSTFDNCDDSFFEE